MLEPTYLLELLELVVAAVHQGRHARGQQSLELRCHVTAGHTVGHRASLHVSHALGVTQVFGCSLEGLQFWLSGSLALLHKRVLFY
jgi:hypothetical protein